MTAFDHLLPGTSEQDWIAAGGLDGLERLSVPGAGESLLVVAAHPDDETLGAGGLIAAGHGRGANVTVVVASDGEASHPRSPTIRPRELARVRRGEVRAAVARLAPEASVHFLGLPDGELEAHQRTLRTRLTALAEHSTHVVSPWDGDRHPDHEACARAARDASRTHRVAHWQYPIWAWHWDDPAASELLRHGVRRVELTAGERDAKRRALQCHRSQHAPLSAAVGDEAILPPSVVAHFLRPFETFVVDAPRAGSTRQFFDDLYAATDDPWGLEDRFYERRKREILLACLPRPRFRRAFEPGCATGLLSEQLAQRCDELIAWDVSERPLQSASDRLATFPGVQLARGAVPDDWPDAELDLIVLSEVGYYVRDLDRLAERVLHSLSPDGVVIACHWRHPAADHPHSARSVHEALDAHLAVLAHHVEEDFLLDVWSRSGISVARDAGIIG